MTTHYIDASGNYLGGWDMGPPEGAIEVPHPPEYADQPWLFPGWGPSPSQLQIAESKWQAAEVVAISEQLDALEEAEAGESPVDLLPGTRTQWLKYRGQVRNWKEGAEHYPDSDHRPIRPA